MNYNKTILRLLTLLGVGSATFMFMACYGPAPQSYRVNPDDIESLTVDTLNDEADTFYQVDDRNPR